MNRRMALFALALAGLFQVDAQVIDLTVEIEVNDWSYWFAQDEDAVSSTPASHGIFPTPRQVRCRFGKNQWKMEGSFRRNSISTRLFTGSNIVEVSAITVKTPPEFSEKVPATPVLATSSPALANRWTTVNETGDGNPGRPVGVEDLMETTGKIVWLAFCSAAALQKPEALIPPPSDLWKQYFTASSKFRAEVKRFDDELGLPQTIRMHTEKGQLLFQYQAHRSTNLVGWNIPLEFYMIQYNPSRWPRTNAWETHLTVKGKVLGIKIAETLD